MSDDPGDNPLLVALLVTSVFEKLGITYYIAGSVASTYYGDPRMTHDIDLVANLSPEHVEGIVESLGEKFYVDAEMISDAIRSRRSFNLLHHESAYKVDVFIPRSTASTETRFERRILQPITRNPDRFAYISSPEDLILSKLEWYELGHRTSERQWADILGVIRVQRDRLDRDYLTRWAAELGVSDLLAQAFRDAG